jgi:hypothetical protein
MGASLNASACRCVSWSPLCRSMLGGGPSALPRAPVLERPHGLYQVETPYGRIRTYSAPFSTGGACHESDGRPAGGRPTAVVPITSPFGPRQHHPDAQPRRLMVRVGAGHTVPQWRDRRLSPASRLSALARDQSCKNYEARAARSNSSTAFSSGWAASSIAETVMPNDDGCRRYGRTTRGRSVSV